MMQAIRSNLGKILVFLIVPAFVAWMVFEVGLEATGGGAMRANEIGRVNGRIVSPEVWQNTYNQNVDEARRQYGTLSPEVERDVRQRTWDQLVAELLLDEEIARRGIRVSNDEIRWAALNVPHPGIAQQEIFFTDGRFDMARYREFITGPTASAEILAELERYFRQVLPREKLFRQVTAGHYLTDAELWRAFRDRSETVTVEYVSLDLTRLVPGDVTVTDDEIRRRYDRDRERFRRPEQARFTLAYIPVQVTEADREAVIQRARDLRQRIVAGEADFDEVARRESRDPGSAAQGGDLGTFGRGQMVPQFDSAAFALPVGEVSEPVVTQFGVHLIQVQERMEEADMVRARHILLPFEKSDAEMARLDARADSLMRGAELGNLERAARSVNATMRENVLVTEEAPFVPGVGSVLEALQWAAAEHREGDEPNPVSDVFQNDNALYVVRMDSYTPRGRMTLQEATPQIRAQLTLEKKRAQARAEGERIIAEVRGGRSLAEAAEARGLQMQTAGPFSRMDPNPAFGEGNAPVGAAFGTPVGELSGVTESTAGLFIVRPVERTTADREQFEQQKEALRASTERMVREQLISAWLEGLREEARIVDNREQVFGRL